MLAYVIFLKGRTKLKIKAAAGSFLKLRNAEFKKRSWLDS